MENPIIIIDKPEVQAISMSRGQILRLSFTPNENECAYNDNIKFIISYAKTPESVISTGTIENGLITKKDGQFFIQMDGKLIRECHDVVYGELFGYGTGHRNVILNIGLNNSAY